MIILLSHKMGAKLLMCKLLFVCALASLSCYFSNKAFEGNRKIVNSRRVLQFHNEF